MQPLFPRWSNTALWAALFLGGAGILGFPIALMIWARTPDSAGYLESVDQPVLFDHRHHVRDDGIDCLYCHYMAEEAATAGIPPTELCMNCHSQIWNESPLLEPVRTSWFTGTPIPWRRVHRLPDFVFFNHAVHVRNGIDCASCHGRVEEMAQVYSVYPMRMGWCLDCHRDPARHVIPPARATDPLGGLAVAGRSLPSQGPTNCTACHR